MKHRLLAIVFTTFSAAAALAEGRPYVERIEKTFPLNPNGYVLVENPNGAITVVGSDRSEVRMNALIEIRGIDEAAVAEGRSRTKIGLGGNALQRVIRTHTIYPVPGDRWTTSVTYRIEVPRAARVSVNSFNASSVEVSRIAGPVAVKSAKGPVRISNVTGGLLVDAVNGSVNASFAHAPRSDVRIYTVNAPIEVRLPGNSQFAWVAETLKGDLFHAFEPDGDFSRGTNARLYRARINGGQSPVVYTSSVTSPIYLLPARVAKAAAVRLAPTASSAGGRSQNRNAELLQATFAKLNGQLLAQPTVKTFAVLQPQIDGDIRYQISVGNIVVGDVRGEVNFFTGAGEIVVARIFGNAELTSRGGPINVGDVFGRLSATTGAGDVHVRVANEGGLAATDGGNVEVGTAGGGIVLLSGGGDIRLHRATAAVRAETRSGDITIAADPAFVRGVIDLQTHDGSINLNLPPAFAGNVDITVTTTSESHRIESAIPGLKIERQRVGDKTKIRASGTFNGGGERLVIVAENGNVNITTKPVADLIAKSK